MSQTPDMLMADVERRMMRLCRSPSGVLQNSVHHHMKSGGSRVRARMALDAALSLKLSHQQAVAIATACELLHNASLIHDDLQDRDATRRGQPAVWAEYGSEVAICAGDLLLSGAYAALGAVGESAADLITIMHERVAATIHGQSEDLDAAKRVQLSLEDYETIAANKSGPLLSLPLELALRLARREDHVITAQRAIKSFALGYQMLDDLDDAFADEQAGEINAVNILASAGAKNPERDILNRARSHLDNAAYIAQTLPAAMPQIIKGYIDALMLRTRTPQELPA